MNVSVYDAELVERVKPGATAESLESTSMRERVAAPVRLSVGRTSARPCGSFSRPASSAWRADEYAAS